MGENLVIFQPCFTVRANMELAQIYPFHGASQELFLVSSVVLRNYTQGMTLTTPLKFYSVHQSSEAVSNH